MWSWDALGSHNILLFWIGKVMKCYNGAITVFNTVFPRFLRQFIQRFLCSPPAFRAPRKETLPPFHLNTGRSRTSSVSRLPLSYHLTGHGTVPSTCCLEPNSLRAETFDSSQGGRKKEKENKNKYFSNVCIKTMRYHIATHCVNTAQ